MLDDDPLLTQDINKHLDAVRVAKETEQLARDWEKLKTLMQSQDEDVHGNLHFAFGVIEKESQCVSGLQSMKF